MDDLRQLIRDLIRLEVGLEVGKDGGPVLTLPDNGVRWRAGRAVKASLETIRANRDALVELWAEVAVEVNAGVWVCRECRALVLDPEEGAKSRWTFCESLSCPYRQDEEARRYQQRWLPLSEQTWRDRLAKQHKTRRLALGLDEQQPIPE